VHRAGAPSIDHLRRNTLFTREQLDAQLHIDLGQPSVVVVYHPVTIVRDTTQGADALFAALREVSGQILFCYPNSDAGSRELIQRTEQFLSQRSDARIFVNLPALSYWSLLRNVDLMIGNSSSGIMETPSFALPTVNVGMRQQGRERARNILDAAPEKAGIVAKVEIARSQQFRHSLEGMQNPYGDGQASEKIVSVLTSVPLGEKLLIKKMR
jgi:UDP-N-acetylglucosamine 2-epimerase (non-hydrolysing)/GDP/UDP-N,N'-diacetylbacillosamine 2-epimerase (hydrolysing)